MVHCPISQHLQRIASKVRPVQKLNVIGRTVKKSEDGLPKVGTRSGTTSAMARERRRDNLHIASFAVIYGEDRLAPSGRLDFFRHDLV